MRPLYHQTYAIPSRIRILLYLIQLQEFRT